MSTRNQTQSTRSRRGNRAPNRQAPKPKTQRKRRPRVRIPRPTSLAVSPAFTAFEAESANQMRRNIQNAQRSAYEASDSILPAHHPLKHLVHEYLATLIDPKSHMCRIPDSEARPTALVRSVMDLTVSTDFSGTADDGRFSVLVQPILGKDGTDPSLYKLAIPKVPYVNPPHWGDPASYVQNLAGFNVRQDRYIQQLTGQPPFFFGINDDNNTSQAAPFGVLPNEDPLNYGSSITFTYVGGTGQSPTLSGGPGVFLLDVFMAEATPGYTLSGAATLTATQEHEDGPPGAHAMIINASDNWTLVFTASADPVEAWFTLVPTFANGIPPWQNSGAISTMRPVATTVLFTCSQAALSNGGMVTGAYVPANTCGSQYLSNVTGNGVGQLQYWEALQALGESFPISHGCYVWWSPEDVEDRELLTPEQCNQHDYPCLIVSGQLMAPPTGAYNGKVTVGRIEVISIYEFTTNVQLWEKQICVGGETIIDDTFRLLSLQPHYMENATHREWVMKVLKGIAQGALKGGRFLYENRDTLLPLIAKAGALL